MDLNRDSRGVWDGFEQQKSFNLFASPPAPAGRRTGMIHKTDLPLVP